MSESVALLWWRAFRVALTTMAKGVVWGFSLLVVAYFCLAYWFADSGGDTKEDSAQIQVGQLMSAVKSYHRLHQAHPTSLDDLLMPKDGRKPLIGDGPYALLDPWGNKFQYTITPGPDGQVDQIVVWTPSPRGKRIKRVWLLK